LPREGFVVGLHRTDVILPAAAAAAAAAAVTTVCWQAPLIGVVYVSGNLA
jgi:hypothetical protein